MYLLYIEGFVGRLLSWDGWYCSCLPDADSIRLFLKIYYLSKILEFVDIFGCILRGIPLHPHFRIHHCKFSAQHSATQQHNARKHVNPCLILGTTLSLAYTFLISASAHAGLFMAANLLVHSVNLYPFLLYSILIYLFIYLFLLIY